jgi:hypothetical protein
VVPSPDAVTVREHHSFIELPEPGYEPRAFDPQSGFFFIDYADSTAPLGEPMTKRFIARAPIEEERPGSAKQ